MRNKSHSSCHTLGSISPVSLAAISFPFNIICTILTFANAVPERWKVPSFIVLQQRCIAFWQIYRPYLSFQQFIWCTVSLETIELKLKLIYFYNHFDPFWCVLFLLQIFNFNLRLLVVCPHPVTVKGVVSSSSAKDVDRQAGRMSSVNQIRLTSLINAMSFFFFVIEYFGCRMISYFKWKTIQSFEHDSFHWLNNFFTLMFWLSALLPSSSSKEICSMNENKKVQIFMVQIFF